MKAPPTPWGMRMVTDRLPHGFSSHDTVTLDPGTQIAVYRDAMGSIIEAGRHGTNRTVGTATMSGGDGQRGQNESQDDNATDYDTD